jgi:HEAT repeat protein
VAKRPKHGFRDYVKNPDLFREEAREIDRADAAPAPAADRLAALVAALATRRPEYEDLQRLRKAGKKAVPLLIAALQDPTFLFHRYGAGVLDGTPMVSAFDLLEPFAEPPAAVLEPALRHEEEYFRYQALYHLARCGNDDAIPALEGGLASPSERCRTYALMGLEFLAKSGRGSGRFRRALFDAALPLLHDREYGPAGHAPRALLALDRERAVEVLSGAEVLRPDNRNVHNALRALKDAEVGVPAARLRALLAAVRDGANSYPFDYGYADGLILLARAEGKAAADVIADAQEWGNLRVRKAAAEAAGIVAGVRDAYAVVIDRFEGAGADGLSEPQLYYLTLSWLDAEVRNGGFSQYFFNSSGDLAGHAVEAAGAVGATEAARVIRKAVELFGPDGPNPDRDKRMDQLSTIDLATLKELDTRYYDCPDDLWELLPLYVARHPDEFRRPGPRR